jgi:hypothetical protein
MVTQKRDDIGTLRTRGYEKGSRLPLRIGEIM